MMMRYLKTVDPKAGLSRSGPAVKFLRLALARIVREKPSAAAIEKALQRSWHLRHSERRKAVSSNQTARSP